MHKKQSEWRIKEYDKAHRYKIAFDVILEFLHLLPDGCFENPEYSNFSVKDYGLEQFQWYVCRKLEESSKEKKL